jgi:hypothetical protein
MTRDTRNMSAEELAAEGITVAEAVGNADNGGRKLSMLIEMGMHEAAQQVRDLGIADDCPAERCAEILGVPNPDGKVGADFIRDAKLAARARIRETFAVEEAERRTAVEAKLRGE